MRVVALSTSFPRHEKDEQSIFIKRLYDAIGMLPGIELTLITPRAFEGTLPYRHIALEIASDLFTDRGLIGSLKHRPTACFNIPNVLKSFATAAMQEKPDIVHANWSLCGAATRYISAPSVTTLRGSDVHLISNPAARIVTRVALSKSTTITAVSGSLAATASHALNRSIFCIENGVDLAQPEPIKLPQQYFISVGTVSPIKNTVGLLSAFAPFARAHPDYALVIAGRLSNSAYVDIARKTATELGIEQQVQLLGAISPGQITSALQGAVGYCGFSIAEGRPNAVLEAHTAGVRCILSDIPAHREMQQNGDRIIDLTQEYSDRDWTGIFEDFLSSSNEQTRRFGVTQRNWLTCAQEYANLFSMVVSGSKH